MAPCIRLAVSRSNRARRVIDADQRLLPMELQCGWQREQATQLPGQQHRDTGASMTRIGRFLRAQNRATLALLAVRFVDCELGGLVPEAEMRG
jgi:hypothetical protein